VHLVVRTRYDDRGQRVELSYFDAAGRRGLAPGGFSYEETSRDERGHVLERRFFDAEGRPVVHQELKAARLRYSYDDLGRKRGEECFDEVGRLLRTNRFGEHTAPEERVNSR
jgi:YD repeat-containing protein